MQLGLGGPGMGEAAVVVGPTGQIALIDAGNDSHDDELRELLTTLDARITESAGFSARAPAVIDHALITHFHADHGDGLRDLVTSRGASGYLLHRGFVDLVEDTNTTTVEKVCEASTAFMGGVIALCEDGGDRCAAGAFAERPAAPVECPGLDAGDLTIAGDSGPAFLPLGGGARVSLLAANAMVIEDGDGAVTRPADGVNLDENARSVVALLEHGEFRLLITGDLAGSERTGIESFYATRPFMRARLGDDGVDVLHVGHHGRDPSSRTWLDLLLPADGRDRNGVIGVGSRHWGSPDEDAIARLTENDRLGRGLLWTTNVAPAGDDAPELVDAGGGDVVIRTFDGGRGYFVQALGSAGAPLRTEAFRTAHRGDPGAP